MLRVVGDSTEVAVSEDPRHFAAVDLGSNSFRLQIGRVIDDQIYPMDSIKESVRLASGITSDKRLDEPAQQRALAALSRFGERLRGFDKSTVRVVGTNALRVARNAPDFLPLAEKALGFPIEIIAGREEARLIYVGVVHSLPPFDGPRLVVDIGGGSTEFIVGRQMKPLLLESLYMGCVSYSERFFPGGKVDKKRFREAETMAGQEIERIAAAYGQVGWGEAVGSSGSARAIAELLEANGLNPGGVGGITWRGLESLRSLMIQAGSIDRLELRNLPLERLPVLVGGVAILYAIFSGLGIERMKYAGGALRLGVLYDLLGRLHQRDMRDTTVRHFKRRYHVDLHQSARVEQAARALFKQLNRHPCNLAVGTKEDQERENAWRFLQWAAALHEIGLSVAHSDYHKHGAYILAAADMPGFSTEDQERLAKIVLGQRGKLEKLAALSKGNPLWTLIFCLRLAVLLCRSRDDRPFPEIHVGILPSGVGYEIELPDAWGETNPLSAAALSDESALWRRVGIDFQIKYRPAHLVAIA
ncbi:exopolyphosphatase [Propionivibrio soli]|uniref:exopolyphosphatase n=1 Tax=Propionivibrio soli TaxID=2976531 RepID=UPI0021E6FA6D|nr:exopolyphosphatase [Propionivibrio soli]